MRGAHAVPLSTPLLSVILLCGERQTRVSPQIAAPVPALRRGEGTGGVCRGNTGSLGEAYCLELTVLKPLKPYTGDPRVSTLPAARATSSQHVWNVQRSTAQRLRTTVRHSSQD